MNSKRRAELQRKLTLNAVPRPPAGLAERIKADIPQYLEPESTASRFTRTINFNLRIAASIVVLATSVVVAMMMIQDEPAQKVAEAPSRVVMFPPASRAVATTDTTTTMQVARTEEVHLDIVQEAPALPQIASARVAPPAPAMVPERQMLFDESRAQRDARSDVEFGAEREDDSYGVVGAVAGGRVAEAQPQVADAAAPPAEFAPEPVEEVALAPAAPAPVAESITVTGEAPEIARRERAATAKLAAAPAMAPPPSQPAEAKKQDSVFGISVSSQAFYDIRSTLESGRRPAASSVNVEALVNYFAGPPEKRPRRVNLEVEASPAAIAADGDHAVLRFTVETPDSVVPKTSTPANARIEVVINNAVVEKARRIGDSQPLAGESVLRPNTSVTGLYELELKPGLRESQLIATVRLKYFDGKKQQTLAEPVHGRDLAKSWQRSSRRHRLASLGALWGESLKSTSGGEVDVARRAQELATQEPDDVRARELARAATASAGGR